MKLATLCYIIDREKNCTLMLHRIKKENDFHEGKWNGLGGKFELHETPEECVIREIEEESGLKISSPRLLWSSIPVPAQPSSSEFPALPQNPPRFSPKSA